MFTKNGRRLLVGLALLTSLPAMWVLQPFLVDDWFTICPFRTVTGCPCPLCGVTRALASALHGHFRTSFNYHPLWPLAAVLIICFGAMHVSDGIFGTNLAERATRFAARGWLPIVLLVIVAAVWRAL